eukprot:2693408-Rhodomonas_salina.1
MFCVSLAGIELGLCMSRTCMAGAVPILSNLHVLLETLVANLQLFGGRGLAQDLVSAASALQVEIAVITDFQFGEEEQIDSAISALAEQSIRIVICAAYHSDFPVIAASADKYGMLREGFAWIIPFDVAIDDVVAFSRDPASTFKHITGWLTAAIDPMYGEGALLFQNVLESEAVQHLNHSGLEGLVTEDVIKGGQCDVYCGLIYDALWTAAIALARVGLAQYGSVDKEALLSAIREVSFEGASGRLQYLETGERDTSLLPLVVKNVRPSSRRAGESTLSAVETWRWWPDTVLDDDIMGRLDRQSSEPPVWPGGGSNWTVPVDMTVCPSGYVYSQETVKCEPCPPGSHLVDRECVPCPQGTFSDQYGAVQCSRCQVALDCVSLAPSVWLGQRARSELMPRAASGGVCERDWDELLPPLPSQLHSLCGLARNQRRITPPSRRSLPPNHILPQIPKSNTFHRRSVSASWASTGRPSHATSLQCVVRTEGGPCCCCCSRWQWSHIVPVAMGSASA